MGEGYVDAWTAAAAIAEGSEFRAINKTGRVWGKGMSPKILWDVVRAAAARAGLDKLAPHHAAHLRLSLHLAGELDQIKFLLGHVSIQTTERYLGCKHKRETTDWASHLMPLDQDLRQGEASACATSD